MLRGLLALAVLALAAGQTTAQERGNILLIVGDDMGVGEVGAYGTGPDPPATPVLDALAAAGVLFQNAWATPVCSSTRAALMTGRHGFRTSVGGNVRAGSGPLPLGELTIPELLDWGTGGGYAHAAFGKWHLGDDTVGGNLAPNLAGFGHFAGALDGRILNYFTWRKVVDGDSTLVTNYATTENVDDALAWVQNAPEPWFCYVAFNAPHGPLHWPPSRLHTESTGGNVNPRTQFRAMVQAMDTEIGRLLDGLGEQAPRTNVIFLGDNGTAREALAAEAPPWQHKGRLFEGGVHVPLIVAGPAVDHPGSECGALVHAVDLFATVGELAGVDLSAKLPAAGSLDALSLVPYLTDPALPGARKWAFVEFFGPNGGGALEFEAVAASDGEYKLVLSKNLPERHERMALFHLASDPDEEFNLLHLHPPPLEARKRYELLRRALDSLGR